ncbi:unnamed protein product [marine sediment metagenome]|uniref:Uncharacterized protein n=1 Tax=marine sediment metagenome TaxID=412755 RepID=X0YWY5_9ZZZZ
MSTRKKKEVEKVPQPLFKGEEERGEEEKELIRHAPTTVPHRSFTPIQTQGTSLPLSVICPHYINNKISLWLT